MRIAAIGVGGFAARHVEAWSRIPGAEVVAVCGHSSIEKAQTFADRWRVPEVYMDPARMMDAVRPDLIDIISTAESHAPLVRLCAERRIPAICQKPLALDLPDAISVVQTAEAADTLLVAHENWRFKPWCREVDRLLRSGALGSPYAVAFQMRFGYDPPVHGYGPEAYASRPYLRDAPRLLIHEIGIHVIDVFRFLFGEIVSVCAHTRRLNPIIAGEDVCYVLCVFADGAAGVLDGDRLAEFEARDKNLTNGLMRIECADGYVRLDGDGGLWIKRRGEHEARHPYECPSVGYAGDCVRAQQAHILQHLTAGTTPENTGREYLNNILVEEAVYRSAAERRWIVISDLAKEFPGL